MGLLLDDPKQMGLLSLGLRLMSTPGRFGQAFGKAGLGAMGDVRQAQTEIEQRKMRELQAKMVEQQLAEAQWQAAERKRQADERQATNQYMVGATAGPDAAMPDTMPGPRRDPAGFDLGSALRANVPLPVALQLSEQLRKQAPKRTVVGEHGPRVVVEVEHGHRRDEVHVRVEIGVDRSHVPPVAALPPGGTAYSNKYHFSR